MRIEDRFLVDAPKSLVWRAIRDPELVAPCVPGCKRVEVLTPAKYRAIVQVSLGPIKAEFNVEVEIVSETPFEEIRTRSRGEEGGRASSLSAENILKIAEVAPDQTEISYSSEVSVFGRLGRFGLAIMQKKAEALGREFAEKFRGAVDGLTRAEGS
ncbi:MAG TPA: SRPBCC domain-containing protein [Xanthobacteraceae bacterium]|jgi:hypothetical protein